MQKNFIILLILLFGINSYCQNQIIGKWLSDDGEGITEIFRQNDTYFGKITWLKQPNDVNGIPFTDTKNPDIKKNNLPLIGLVILKNFEYKNHEWINGTIYDPESGKTYTCTMWLVDENTIKVRGYWGFFFETQKWTKTK
ncbi:MAG: DUF2147 domain-containing protein [Bacteroidales bacterium]|nr:DUF2147 domain-containing protein [Bacteroidales bacterium]